MRSSDSSTPDVIAAGVNEWPAPIAFTRCRSRWAAATIAATSSVEHGMFDPQRTARSLPAQLRTGREPTTEP